MAEFFLAPAFLWGAAAASAPILIHLLARQRYRRVQWAAMEFLRRAMKRTQRRLRLENLLLLLLRTAAVLLLAMALARPVLSRVPILSGLNEQERVVVLAIDRSASMGAKLDGPTPFERARTLAAEIVTGLRARDEVYLCWVADRPEAVFDGPTPEKGRVREELDTASPGDGATRWAPALAHIAEILARPEVKAKPVRHVFCLTDLQRTGWLGGDEAGAPAAGAAGGIHAALETVARLADEVVLLDVGLDGVENTGVVSLAAGDRVVGVDRSTRVTAEARNFGAREAMGVTVRLLVDDRPHPTTKTIPALPPGESRTVDFQVAFARAGAHRLTAEVPADGLASDNRRDLAAHVREQVRVLVVDGNPEETDHFEHEAFHLRLQLNPSEEGAAAVVPSLVRPVVYPYTQLASARLSDFDCVIVANDGAAICAPAGRAALAGYVRDGGALLVIPGSRVNPDDYRRELYLDAPEPAPDGRGLVPVPFGAAVRVTGEGDASELEIVPADWTHPLFRAFDDPRWRELLQFPAVRRHFGVDGALAPGARVLAHLSDLAQTPAIVERRVGAGRVCCFTFGWTRAWGKLYARQGGLVLLNETLLHLARDPAPERTVRLGAPLRWIIEGAQYHDQASVRLPTSGSKRLDPPAREGERFAVHLPETRQVGFHTVVVGPDAPLTEPAPEGRSALFAVVGDPAEGNLARATETQLCDGLDPSVRPRVRVARAVRASATGEGGAAQEVSRPLLALVFLLLLAESWLARRLGRRGAE